MGRDTLHRSWYRRETLDHGFWVTVGISPLILDILC